MIYAATMILAALATPEPTEATLRRFGTWEQAQAEWAAVKWWKCIGCPEYYQLPSGDPFPSRYRPWCKQGWDEADRLYQVYDRLTDAWAAERNSRPQDARTYMDRIRELVGEEAYWSGQLPPVPK